MAAKSTTNRIIFKAPKNQRVMIWMSSQVKLPPPHRVRIHSGRHVRMASQRK